MDQNQTKKTVLVGAMIVVTLFVLGVTLILLINIAFPNKQFRDVAIIFASAIAAMGAIIAAFIAFQAGHQIEAEKDRRERLRRIDEERTRTEAALVSLHVAATFIDGLYRQVQDFLDPAKNALTQCNFTEYRRIVGFLPAIPTPFPLINDIDIRFMRLSEQHAIRAIEVSLELLRKSIESVHGDVQIERSMRESMIAELGQEGFFVALDYNLNHVEQSAKKLFKDVAPYINARRPSVIPDESKLRMLVGDFSGGDIIVTSLDEALEQIRIVASKLLREHVEARDVRSSLLTVAESVKDEDSLSIP